MAENLISQAELQAFAPSLDLSAYNTATISGMITRASSRVIQYCSVDGFLKQTVLSERERVRIDTMGNLIISFRRRPVAMGDVLAVRLITVDVNTSLTLANGISGYTYFIPASGESMSYASNFLISHGVGLFSVRGSNLFYEVDYIGGYSTIPDDLKQATSLLVAEQVAQDSNLMGAVEVQQGSYRVKYQGNADASGLSLLTKRAYDILDQAGYVRQVIF